MVSEGYHAVGGTNGTIMVVMLRKGENFFDMITTSNIAYSGAIVDNIYEYWDQCLVLKNMTLIKRKTYMDSVRAYRNLRGLRAC